MNILVENRAVLGEGAIWDHMKQVLYWIDIEGKKLFCYHPEIKSNKTYHLPQRIGTVVPCQGDKLLLALEDGLYYYSLVDEKLSACIQRIEHDLPENRCNDGKCDANGKFWIGTMPLTADKPTGSLYNFSLKNGLNRVMDKLTVSNGMGWNSSGNEMYYIDSAKQAVQIFRYNLAKGVITEQTDQIAIPPDMGIPDGMTVDSENNIWVALWNGNAVICCNPNTLTIEKVVHVQAKHVTSCAFGGKDLATLFITTASIGLSSDELSRFPDSGKLISIENIGAKGTPANFFMKNDTI